jgi:ribosomal-protein-serine acetyltransferase
MTAATAALIDWGFTGPWQLHRIQIQAGIGNAPSRAIPERLGFTWEGTRRDAGLIGERFIDLAVYGLLADEWAGYPAA